jgi:hypothetical protein
VSCVHIGAVAVGIQNPVEKRYESAACAALRHDSIQVRDHGQHRSFKYGLRRNDSLNQRSQQGCRHALSGHVAECKSKASAIQIEIIKIVSADLMTGTNLAAGLNVRQSPVGWRKQRLLNFSGKRQLFFHPAFVFGIPIQPRVIDGHGRFGCKGFQRIDPGF